jgi:hypothetical protein
MHFRTVGGQDSHEYGALLIGSGVVRERKSLFHI